jgi:hypothetical protein
MIFKYLDSHGKVVFLPDVPAFIEAIRQGAITAETRLALGERDNFQPAGSIPAYQHAVVVANRAPELHAPVPIPPWYRRRNVRLAALVVGAVLLVVLVALRLRSLDRRSDLARQRSVTEAGAHTAAAALRITTEFGDSTALAQRRLQDWVAQQRFNDRLRGSAVQSLASLRAVRIGSVTYRVAVDSLLVRSRSLAAALVQRADSLENADVGLNGLMEQVENELAAWQRDLAAWADLERGTAATFDSLAAFMVDRQQSFAVRDGQLMFVSRSDADRFRELGEALFTLTSRETAWAEAVRLKYPEWMAALPADARPRFGRTPVSAP